MPCKCELLYQVYEGGDQQGVGHGAGGAHVEHEVEPREAALDDLHGYQVALTKVHGIRVAGQASVEVARVAAADLVNGVFPQLVAFLPDADLVGERFLELHHLLAASRK